MKTPDEIKKGLECCVIGPSAHQPKCGECPYKFTPMCSDVFLKDALALIQQLEHNNVQLAIDKAKLAAENAEQADRIRQLEVERDALIDDIRTEGGLCALCKHEDARAWAEPCCRCNALVISGESHWEWRGVQKEE